MASSSSPKQEDDDDDDIINPFKMLLSAHGKEDDVTQRPQEEDCAGKPQLQHHYLPSIDSTVVVRQLPSEGLSFKVWPAAATLVTLLDSYKSDPTNSPLLPTLSAIFGGEDRRKLNILELGSGTGLVGIAAAVMLGANVTVTDLPHVIPNLQFNVDANAEVISVGGGKVRVAALSWGKEGDVKEETRYDLVLGSDVVYHDHLFEPLLETLRLVMGRNEKMTFLMAHLRRWKKEAVFFKRAKKLFDVDVAYVASPCNGSRTGVVVYRFATKGQKMALASIPIR